MSDGPWSSQGPPPPPPVSGNIPAVRLKSEIGDRRPEPPACVQNAMMTKDKKPFTYTPGGIDLSEIKSPRMARRIERNANAPGVGEMPKQYPNYPQQSGPLPPSALAAMQPALPVQVFPIGPPPPPPMSAPPPPPPPMQPLPTKPIATNEGVFERPDMTRIIPENPMALLRRTPRVERKSFVDEMGNFDSSNIVGKPQQPQNKVESESQQYQRDLPAPQLAQRKDDFNQQKARKEDTQQLRGNGFNGQQQRPGYGFAGQQQVKEDLSNSQRNAECPTQKYEPPSMRNNQNGARFNEQRNNPSYSEQYQNKLINSNVGSLYIPPVPVEVQDVQSPPTPPQRQPQSPIPKLNAAPKPWQTPKKEQEVPEWAQRPQREDNNQGGRIMVQPPVNSTPVQQYPQVHPMQQTRMQQPQQQQPQQQQPQQQQQMFSQPPMPRMQPQSPMQQNLHYQQRMQPPPPKPGVEVVWVTQPEVYVHPGPGAPPSAQRFIQPSSNNEPANSRVIPIKLEGSFQATPSPTPNDRNFNRQQSWTPTQSNSFKVIQKMTNTDGYEGDEGQVLEHGPRKSQQFPTEQVRKMNLSDDFYLGEYARYRGGLIPSRVFWLLDESVPQDNHQRGPIVRTIPIQLEGDEPPKQYVHPSQQSVQEPKKYTGSAIPSKAFKMVQAMTSNTLADDNNQNENYENIDPSSTYENWGYENHWQDYYPYYYPNPNFIGENSRQCKTPVPFWGYPYPPPPPPPQFYPKYESNSDTESEAKMCSSCRNTPVCDSSRNTPSFEYSGYWDPYYYGYYYGYPMYPYPGYYPSDCEGYSSNDELVNLMAQKMQNCSQGNTRHNLLSRQDEVLSQYNQKSISEDESEYQTSKQIENAFECDERKNNYQLTPKRSDIEETPHKTNSKEYNYDKHHENLNKTNEVCHENEQQYQSSNEQAHRNNQMISDENHSNERSNYLQQQNVEVGFKKNYKFNDHEEDIRDDISETTVVEDPDVDADSESSDAEESIEEINIPRFEIYEEDDDTPSEGSAEDHEIIYNNDETIPHVLSIIFEESERSDCSRLDRYSRESSVVSDDTVVDDNSDQEIVSVKLPLKLSYSKNSDEVTHVTVGIGEVNSFPWSDVSTEFTCKTPESNVETSITVKIRSRSTSFNEISDVENDDNISDHSCDELINEICGEVDKESEDEQNKSSDIFIGDADGCSVQKESNEDEEIDFWSQIKQDDDVLPKRSSVYNNYRNSYYNIQNDQVEANETTGDNSTFVQNDNINTIVENIKNEESSQIRTKNLSSDDKENQIINSKECQITISNKHNDENMVSLTNSMSKISQEHKVLSEKKGDTEMTTDVLSNTIEDVTSSVSVKVSEDCLENVKVDDYKLSQLVFEKNEVKEILKPPTFDLGLEECLNSIKKKINYQQNDSKYKNTQVEQRRIMKCVKEKGSILVNNVGDESVLFKNKEEEESVVFANKTYENVYLEEPNKINVTDCIKEVKAASTNQEVTKLSTSNKAKHDKTKVLTRKKIDGKKSTKKPIDTPSTVDNIPLNKESKVERLEVQAENFEQKYKAVEEITENFSKENLRNTKCSNIIEDDKEKKNSETSTKSEDNRKDKNINIKKDSTINLKCAAKKENIKKQSGEVVVSDLLTKHSKTPAECDNSKKRTDLLKENRVQSAPNDTFASEGKTIKGTPKVMGNENKPEEEFKVCVAMESELKNIPLEKISTKENNIDNMNTNKITGDLNEHQPRKNAATKITSSEEISNEYAKNIIIQNKVLKEPNLLVGEMKNNNKKCTQNNCINSTFISQEKSSNNSSSINSDDSDSDSESSSEDSCSSSSSDSSCDSSRINKRSEEKLNKEISDFNNNAEQQDFYVPTIKERIRALHNASKNSNSKSTSNSKISKKIDDNSEDDIDSGVTSDMSVSRHISDTETDFPELRKMNKYQRAATHSRLYKLLQGECDEEEESGEINYRKENLSLPLNTTSSGYESLSSSCINSPSSPINEKLVNELIASLLRKKKGKALRNIPMEKLKAAAIKILQEERDLSLAHEDTSYPSPLRSETDSSAIETPQEFYSNSEYKQYYNSFSEYSPILPSKAFKLIQEHAVTNKAGNISGFSAKCPRVISSKNLHKDLDTFADDNPANQSAPPAQ